MDAYLRRYDDIPNSFHLRIALLSFAVLFWYGYALASALLGASLIECAFAALVWFGNVRVRS